MSRTGTPPGRKVPIEQKVRVVLAVLAGEVTLTEAGWNGASPEALGEGQTERALRGEVEQLKPALAEATVQLRIWRVGAEMVAAVPSQTSKP